MLCRHLSNCGPQNLSNEPQFNPHQSDPPLQIAEVNPWGGMDHARTSGNAPCFAGTEE